METVKEENEKKKEYLKQYGKALRQEKRIEEELERLKLDRMLPGALAADGLPKSSNLSDLSDYAAEVDEQERKLVERKELGAGLKSVKELSRWKTRQRKIS